MYKVTITKVENTVVKRKEWERQLDDGAYEKALEKDEDVKQYDYVELEREEEIETPILTQRVDDLDVELVIKAINKIK